METLNSGSDRISELPEALLLHILSFLSTIHAVQTSILSRRWRYLWPNVQNLEFDQREFSTEYAITEDIHPSSTIRFVNFVHWVLFRRNHDSNVGRFQLWWKFSFNMNFASIWVEYALSHSVRELILYLTPNNFDELPRNIFTCQSLEECRLETPYLVQFLPDSVGFSKLRSLSLEGIIRGDLDGLISNCPVLEDLSLALETGNLNIYAPNLKWLSLSCNGISKPGKVHISTPSLVSFSYDSVGLVQCSLVHAPSLHEAYISIRQDRDGNSGNVTQIIGSLCNVVVLTLKKSTIELLSKVPDLSKCVLPFHNLKYLELRSEETFLTKAIQVIAILLEKCPNLVTLIIRKTFEKGEYQSDMFELEDEWTPQKMQYRCDLHHLYEIEIHGFDGGKDELEFIYFLLEKASALEKVDLICNEGSPHLAMQIKAWQKIHTLPRASSVAKIVLHQNLVVL